MKKILTSVLILLLSVSCLAEDVTFPTKFEGQATWTEFDRYMQLADEQDRQIGWSYLASGVLVMVGGTLGAQNTTDDATKVVYGVAATLGIGASAYGLERLYNGNNYKPFYESLQSASLTEAQRNQLVARFIELDKERELKRKRIGMITNLVMSGINLYSASQAPDMNTKNFFYAFAGINLALAYSYSF